MEIIGEKINGTRRQIAGAIIDRDGEKISDLAKKQAEAGAAYLDINAGTNPEREAEDMVWLVKTVQAVTEVPLCLDSPNPAAIEAALKTVNKTPMINSISGEKSRLSNILPLAAGHKCPLIALALDDGGIPKSSAERINIIKLMILETRKSNIPDNLIYIDPLAMALSTNSSGGIIALETIHSIRALYPEINFTMGLSNISYGLPSRNIINRTFLTLAMYEGLNSAILDPLDADLMMTILTTELAAGKDRFAQKYLKYHRNRIQKEKSSRTE